MKRVLIVADVSNLFYCIKNRLGGRLDYGKYLNLALNSNIDSELYRAVAYGAAMGTEAQRFQQALQHMGWIVKYKEPAIYPGDIGTVENGRETRKADWDVGIAIDVVRAIDRFDLLVLGSADGDMVPLVEWVQEKIDVHVIACGINSQLRQTARKCTEIGDSLLIKESVLA